ncbi:actophorin-like [Convolutriloba macropyga]|uniref:actophorin-like n=1 Tax=Convolutriloba macropyga TaxID=536237 RepID=UPI003F521D16
MPQSGIKNRDDCKDVYANIKDKHLHKYVIYKIDAVKLKIEPVVVADKHATYAQFLDDLAQVGCCYAVYDFKIIMPDNSTRDKLIFYNWAPDDQPIKAKMLQSTTLKEIEKVTDGIHMKVQASELNEIQEKDIEEQLRKTLRI